MQEAPLERCGTALETTRIDLQQMPTLVMMVICVLKAIRVLAVALIEEELKRRALEPEIWPSCPHCGRTLHSKGFRARQILTLLGMVKWERRIGRCPNGCQNSQIAPLDDRLGIKPGQRTSDELKRLACMFCVFVPFNIAVELLQQLTGVALSADSLWTWCIDAGQRIENQIEAERQAMAEGITPTSEHLPEHLWNAPLAIGADGVMAPLRPQVGTPAGKTIWREIKVGILARLTRRFTKKGKEVPQIEQRRVVAFMGSVDDFMPILRLEANKQYIAQASKVIWLSDGGKGFWRIFESWVKTAASNVTGVLDFYHAAQNIAHAAKAWLGESITKHHKWFIDVRHKLRHGQEKAVIDELDNLRNLETLSDEAKQTLDNAYQYLKHHKDNIHYQEFKSANLPIGSGIVESACKWLIQQRFKGVGMRWSEKGLNALLCLRVAWVNHRFDDFFPPLEPSPI